MAGASEVAVTDMHAGLISAEAIVFLVLAVEKIACSLTAP